MSQPRRAEAKRGARKKPVAEQPEKVQPEKARAAGRLSVDWSVAHRSMSSGTRSGDQHLVRETPDGGVLLAVVDGLGHGEEAAAAAQWAVEILDRHAGEPVTTLLKRCHERLRETRGVVLSLAAYNGAQERLTWLGVGNVEGVLLRSAKGIIGGFERLLLRGGVVGSRLPELREETLPIFAGDILILVTDGVDSRFGVTPHGGSIKEMADGILERHGKATDDALVLVARFALAER